MTLGERQAQMLHLKIYHVLIVYFNVFMPNSFKEKWTWPKRDPKYGLFRDKYCKYEVIYLV
jgi:hypothetical protein